MLGRAADSHKLEAEPRAELVRQDDRNQRPAAKPEPGPGAASDPAGLSLAPYVRSRTKSMVVRFKQFSHEYSEAEEIYVYKFHVDTTRRCDDAICSTTMQPPCTHAVY